jgi:uncharacterized phage-associated protein
MNSVLQIAKFITAQLGTVTTMKLQKLVYYCQAWSLAWEDEPLFPEDFEAWANGPVCPVLYNEHRGLFRVNISEFLTKVDDPDFSPETLETMDITIAHYSKFTPQELSDITHGELPWIEARRGFAPGEPGNVIITKESMRDYYGGL